MGKRISLFRIQQAWMIPLIPHTGICSLKKAPTVPPDHRVLLACKEQMAHREFRGLLD
jgi:hypothetical protein